MKENPRIDLVVKLPACQILAAKFLTDKKRMFISLSNGLMMIYNSSSGEVNRIFVNKNAVVDQVKVIDDKYAICSGIDQQMRIWNFENER